MSESPTFTNLLDEAALFSYEHQLHLEEVLGEHSWNVDLQQPRFEFTGGRTLTCTRFHLLGSAAPGPRTWLWAWANPSGYPPEVTAVSAALCDFGRRHGIPELASAEVPFDALPGPAGEPAFAAALLTEASKAVSGHWTSYNGDADGGTRAAFLVEHPEFRLPAPEPARVMRVLQEGLTGLPVTDRRRALHGYAVRRELGIDWSGGDARLTGPGLEATVAFDEHGRLGKLKATLSPPG